jgi:type I restriction enzyme M protein
VDVDEVCANDGNLNIPLYMRKNNGGNGPQKPLCQVIAEWERSSAELRQSMDELFENLKGAGL